ncbi:MAG: hypothetical protein IPO00_01790 [Betaproteobacteria bacterium]|nr:hypothetical protein [Betaproteobacteria bacterium]
MRSSAERPQSGKVRLDLVVSSLLVFVLMGFLLDSVRSVQYEVERTLVAADVMSLRTELQLAVASAINRGQEAQIVHWAGKNPLELAGRSPGTHSLPAPESEPRIGKQWRWDGARGLLAYDYEDGGQLTLRIVGIRDRPAEGWSLGGGLVLAREQK